MCTDIGLLLLLRLLALFPKDRFSATLVPIDAPHRAVAVTAVSETAVTVTNGIASASVIALLGQEEVRVLGLGLAGRSLVVEKEAATAGGPERPCLTASVRVAGRAALSWVAGTVGDDLEVRRDARAVVGNVGDGVTDAAGVEVGSQNVVALGTSIVESRAGDDAGGRRADSGGLGGEGGDEGGHA